jgi:hypothetical protein
MAQCKQKGLRCGSKRIRVSAMRFPVVSAISACLCASTAQAALIIYYPLDETSGTMAFDAATADGSQDATASGPAPNWQPSGGIVGGGLRFSPTAQTDVDEALIYNTASTSTSLLEAHPFTITLWFNTTSTAGWTRAGVFLGNSTQSAMYYAVSLDASHRPIQIARNTNAIATTFPTAENDGEWHQLTAVYTASNSRSFYVDGRLTGTNTTDVPHMVLNRFGVGALTRSSQTDAFDGLLDEIGLFDAALGAEHAALFNAFPRYDSVRLDGPEYDLALSVFNTQSGSVDTGSWSWSYATGLPGSIGETGFFEGNPYVVLDSSGNGLAAVPEPAFAALLLGAGLLIPALRRARRSPEE